MENIHNKISNANTEHIYSVQSALSSVRNVKSPITNGQGTQLVDLSHTPACWHTQVCSRSAICRKGFFCFNYPFPSGPPLCLVKSSKFSPIISGQCMSPWCEKATQRPLGVGQLVITRPYWLSALLMPHTTRQTCLPFTTNGRTCKKRKN